MKSNKVLILSTIASVVEQFNRNNLKILKKNEFDVTILANFSFGNTISDDMIKTFSDELISDGFRVIDIPIPRKFQLVQLLKSYFIIKNLIKNNNYSFIHCHTPIASFLLRINYFFTYQRKEKIIYTAHGFHFYNDAPLKNWILYYTIEKLLSKYVDCLITINKEDYLNAKIFFKNIKKIIHIYGVGVNLNKFNAPSKNEKNKKRKKLGYSKKDFIIISVAEFNNNKNHKFVIEAIKMFSMYTNKFKLLLVGIGPNKKYIMSFVHKNLLDDFVDFLDYRTDISDLLKISDIFISGSIREGLPVSVIEAMSSGLPIVASLNRGHLQLINNDENGYLVSLNEPDTLSERLIYFYRSKKHRDRVKNNNIKIAKKYSSFFIDKSMEKIYLEVYNC